MRKFPLTLAAAAFVVPAAASAQNIEIGPGGIRVDDGRGRRAGGQCEQLRLACENKDRLGEEGGGNWRRYRPTWPRPARPQGGAQLPGAGLQKGPPRQQ